jgi:all-trans-retinol 13,14-reductase
MHPEQTLAMVEPGKIKKAFITRIKSLENSMGMFTMYIVFKKEMFPYLNYNFYHFNQDNTWVAGEYNIEKWPQNYLLMTTANSKSETYADGCSVITYMDYSEMAKWEHTSVENRGDDYQDYKRKKAEKLIDNVERQFPGFRSCIGSYYTSTPLTWRDYTGTRAGSAYGVLKDFNRPLESFILPRTKIANLFLTGQNINIHGILGVTISSVLTCAELIDIKHLVNKIKNA